MAITEYKTLTIRKFLQKPGLEIPLYQRPYKWTTRHVVQLVEDIQRFKDQHSYRIGTVVVHNEKGIHQIVDGQQRTVTFLLMLQALVTVRLPSLECPKVKNMVEEVNAGCFSPRFSNPVSKANICANYRELERRLASVDEQFISFFLDQCELTYFEIDDITEVFQFFDAQNARGRDLDPHDLLKAFHLREMDDPIKPPKDEVAQLVDTWEGIENKELARLFADFLYRVRGWSKGRSSRYFTKKDTPLFKGINLHRQQQYRFARVYGLVDEYLRHSGAMEYTEFPFQLDQPVINGSHFFRMVSHYHRMFKQLTGLLGGLEARAKQIMGAIETYEGRNRTGDKYVRMLFNCALLHYIDKFGRSSLSKAIEKLFIWAYKPRLEYQNLQLASVDNYVVQESNAFMRIREAVDENDLLSMDVPPVRKGCESPKTAEIKKIFQQMRYYAE